MSLANSTRLPASPADSRTYCTNFEPSVSRSMRTATRAGPFSTTSTFGEPLTKLRGGRCSSSKSMFHAGQCSGLSVEMARRIGADSSSRLIFLKDAGDVAVGIDLDGVALVLERGLGDLEFAGRVRGFSRLDAVNRVSDGRR